MHKMLRKIAESDKIGPQWEASVDPVMFESISLWTDPKLSFLLTRVGYKQQIVSFSSVLSNDTRRVSKKIQQPPWNLASGQRVLLPQYATILGACE